MILGAKFTIKPPAGAHLIVGHPLSDGLVGCWPANESSGSKLFDVSGYGNNAVFQGSAGWRLSRLGWAMDSQGSYNNANTAFDGTQYDELTISAWVVADVTASTRYIVDNSPGSTGFGLRLAGTKLEFFCFSGGSSGLVGKLDFFSVGQLRHIVAVHNSKNVIYGDGVYLGEETSAVGIDSSIERMGIGGDYNGGNGWDGAIVVVQVWNRSLTPGEIVWLYRDPFAMFGSRLRPELLSTLTSGVINIASTSNGQSSASGSVRVARKLIGSTSAESAATAALSISGELSSILPERTWLKDALFAGMTANAFKLGNVLSLGWFWMRVGGCSALYRGPEMRSIDFENILSVANLKAGLILPPCYVEHGGDSTCFYVVRRFNQCGVQERTLAAAVKLSLDTDRDLVEPRPNDIFSSIAEAAEGDKVRLTWFYSVLEQKAAPAYFNIYHDAGTGQIDYDNPIAAIAYDGRKFYSYESSTPGAGRYLFAIRAEDVAGVENDSPALLRIEVPPGSPDAIAILNVQAV
ncbi:MAG: LamG domain-containing protein [Sedimentisphaerales bacterium]|nr:LamG domain-containing protein [Sedimentisphaerales bacterium]